MQTAKVIYRLFVSAHFAGKTLCIKCPAFHIAGEEHLCAECGNIFQFLSNGNLHVMARHTLVISNRFHFAFWHHGHINQVYVVNARRLTIRRARIVMLCSTRLLAERLNPFHHKVCLRKTAKVIRQHFFHVVDVGTGITQITLTALIGIRVIETFVGFIFTEVFKHLTKRTFKPKLCFYLFHLLTNTGDFF